MPHSGRLNLNLFIKGPIQTSPFMLIPAIMIPEKAEAIYVRVHDKDRQVLHPTERTHYVISGNGERSDNVP